MKQKRIPSGTKLPLSFSSRELEDNRELDMIGEEFGQHAAVVGRKVRVDLSLDDMEEIQGHVAAEANHTRDATRRQRLDKLFDKFQKVLDRWDDKG